MMGGIRALRYSLDRMGSLGIQRAGCALLLALAAGLAAVAGEPADLPLLLAEDFESDADRWEPTDPAAWRRVAGRGGNVLAQVAASKYNPPHRSPFNFTLLKDMDVGDFVLDVKVRSTIKDYDHRDVCLIFGHQDPAHFYYVHLGKKADDHANQIFIVDDAPRIKISQTTTDGTPWDDEWHHVRVIRNVEDGKIEIYFDDLEKPAMTATDKAFTHGRIGLGTFDDTAEFDDLELRGTTTAQRPE
ncbi:MAG: hypothetical protein AB7O62_11790 [Pirellulales bacterium]